MSKSSRNASTSGSSRRATTTKVAKPFPWGTVLGSVVLALVLGGILVFAALNPGSGRNRLLTDPDDAIEGVAVASGQLDNTHVTGTVDYDQVPPNSGDHNAVPQTCAVYDAPIAPEHAVHSMEHGALWVTYNDDLPDAEVEELASKMQGDQYRLMSPVPEQTSPINLSAWGRRLSVDSAGDERVDQFLEAYTNGRQAPEPGASCVGNATTGPLQAGAAVPAPSTAPSASVTVPGASTAPSAAASAPAASVQPSPAAS